MEVLISVLVSLACLAVFLTVVYFNEGRQLRLNRVRWILLVVLFFVFFTSSYVNTAG